MCAHVCGKCEVDELPRLWHVSLRHAHSWAALVVCMLWRGEAAHLHVVPTCTWCLAAHLHVVPSWQPTF